jgi:transcriptional regulator with GAF, ATPase, and Fis domain
MQAQETGIGSLSQKAAALERLLLISREISTLDLPTALRLVLRHLLDWTGTRRGALLLADDDRGLRVELAVGLEREELVDLEVRVSRSVARHALETGEIVVIEDALASPYRDQTSILELRLQALLALPLRVRDRVIGVIYVDTDSPRHGVHQLDVSILSTFAAQAAIALDNARLHRQLQEDLLLHSAGEESFHIDNILYRSAAMHRVCRAIRQVAPCDVSVLISGETGTGKELVARAVHYNSARRNRRFLGQNAGALPDTLLESELFGHRRGAFSGALDNKTGLFEAADGGTVFLDEIAEASPAFQVRLLRFLETGTFRRLGETADRRVDVRIVAASHHRLEDEVEAGRFRADLYFRLSVFPIHLPPLRDRPEDLELLVYYFIDRFNGKLGRSVRSVPHAVMADLLARPWPGNVRELQNVVQRLMVLSSGTELAAPPDSPRAPAPLPPLLGAAADPVSDPPLQTLEDVERDYIRQVLRHCGGNQAQAARVLALNRNTLRWRMKKLGL